MSTGMFWLIVLGVYLIGAVGTARAVFTAKYKSEYPLWVNAKVKTKREKDADRYGGQFLTEKQNYVLKHDAHYLTVHDTDVYTPTWWSGAFWFVVAPYLVVIKPVGTVVIPMIVKWFTNPARKAVAS